MDAQQLRGLIYNLNNSWFGKVTEQMVKRVVKLKDGENVYHDLFDTDQQHKIEVKGSIVRQSLRTPFDPDAILSSLAAQAGEMRQVPFKGWWHFSFTCAVAQVKPREFHTLYYCLFFADEIVIFRRSRRQVKKILRRQHKDYRKGGQFHLSHRSLSHHLENNFYFSMTYQDLLDLFGDGLPPP